ncbi:MAG TPA: glutaminyl-peptide cyclotransferase [Pedobacter sp.]|uniref:glutaminyl-peptide cyclotransferase n=1 Tax=Pedobacter sp. TaxID=1411316 RepID=UPI002B63EC06|nr:glutaminyl-peptide cyclotransferase [Pedobacter sp.]HMI02748.1 glutaminyl-peptide cyclotransferase [Pedobacter sp.]
MHSGQVKNTNTFFKIIPVLGLLSGMLFMLSCKDKPVVSGIDFKLPEQGQTFGLGEEIKVQLDLPEGEKLTSATYLLDGKPAGSSSDAKPVVLKTSGLSVGYKIITAIVDRDGVKDTSTISVLLNSGVEPEEYTYKIVKTFPHDTTSYTQGLEYHNGKFLESTGQEGTSTLRWVDIASGKALQRIDLDKKIFGEGAALVGDKVVMLTYKQNSGFIYDAKTFKQLGTFSYQTAREGWGLCFNGQQLIMSDGTNRLYFMNKDTYKDEKVIDVFDNKGAVDSINELEMIGDKLYANIYTYNYIVVIDTKSGIVEKKIDLSGLLPEGYFKDEISISNNVLNGIAYDQTGKRLFVTGKKWPKLFEIALVPKK